MGLFDLFKKSSAANQPIQVPIDNPYHDSATNIIYNLIFCDDLALYKNNIKPPYSYPFDILFSETNSIADLQKIADDGDADPRVRILACNKLLAKGQKPNKKELLAVIVEVGLDGGLDVLASFKNGTARYINQTGKVVIWETTTDANVNQLTNDLFAKAMDVVKQIGPWDKPRKPHPSKGNMRLSFFVSDGLYFGEGSMNVLFNDKLASPTLTVATSLMQYLTKKSLEAKQ